MNELDVKLSKTLSYFLRHAPGRGKSQIPMDDQGFVNVNSLLSLPQFRAYTFSDVERVVRTNDKQRFALIDRDQDGWFIRANQGHTFKVPELELKEITLTDIDRYPDMVHSTFTKFWPSIKEIGLSRMSREHIHFLPRFPNGDERKKASGKLRNCDLFIYVDLKNALQGGHKFYVSANNVVLCPGNDQGILEAKYFSKVMSGFDDDNMKLLT